MVSENQKFAYIFEKEFVEIVLIVGVVILSVGVALTMSKGGLSSDNIILVGVVIVILGFLFKALYIWILQREKGKNDFFEHLFLPRR